MQRCVLKTAETKTRTPWIPRDGNLYRLIGTRIFFGVRGRVKIFELDGHFVRLRNVNKKRGFADVRFWRPD
jgi:hypothetical protein